MSGTVPEVGPADLIRMPSGLMIDVAAGETIDRACTPEAGTTPVAGLTHRHGTTEPGWAEHDHLGGGIPHEHDPETGGQVPLGALRDSSTM
jgi:hypothetical protein